MAALQLTTSGCANENSFNATSQRHAKTARDMSMKDWALTLVQTLKVYMLLKHSCAIDVNTLVLWEVVQQLMKLSLHSGWCDKHGWVSSANRQARACHRAAFSHAVITALNVMVVFLIPSWRWEHETKKDQNIKSTVLSASRDWLYNIWTHLLGTFQQRLWTFRRGCRCLERLGGS